MTDKEYKDEIIKRVMIVLQEIGVEIHDDKTKTKDEKLIDADVLLDTMHFLKDYDENVKVLDKYWREKRRRQHIEPDKDM